MKAMDTLPQVRPTTAVMTALLVIFKTSPPSTRSLSVAQTITYVLHSGSLWGLSTQCTWQSLLSSACFLVLPAGHGSFNFYSRERLRTALGAHVLSGTSIIASKRQSTDFTDRSCTGEGRPHESWRRRKYCSGDADSGLHPHVSIICNSD